MRRPLLWAFILASVMGASGRAWATDDDDGTRATLKRLTAFDVVLGIAGSEEYTSRIDSTALRTSIELRLRESGLKVKEYGVPVLSVWFWGRPAGEGGCISYGRLSVYQHVSLVRDPSITELVSTWTTEEFDACKCTETNSHVAERARSLMDQFMNAFLAANPRKVGGK